MYKLVIVCVCVCLEFSNVMHMKVKVKHIVEIPALNSTACDVKIPSESESLNTC